MIRLGLCCKFYNEPIKFKTTTVTYLKKLISKGENHLLYLDKIVQNNVLSLEKALVYCQKQNIGAFRIGSDFLPASTHEDTAYKIEDLPSGKELIQRLQNLDKQGVRLSFHPDQFVILNSPKEEVVAKSLQDLEYHTSLAMLMGADVINIHGGGAYGDKKEALKRFIKNFPRLSLEAQKRLTVENDDKVFTPEDLLFLCKELSIPLVYDVHHHRCLQDRFSIEEATEKALATWKKEPLFHISSPLEGWDGPRPNRHHDFINYDDMPLYWKEVGNLTIDIEAKAKEVAILQLKKELEEKGWPLT